ncbi:MAG TPA: hypothetical protein P5277_03920 [Candidatus Paceibacterota bacterium]|nr:hypothetical protein [Candidatus Paceibacterota bacterium]
MVKVKKEKNSEKAVPERAKVENIEEVVIDLAKKGNHPAKIGLILKEKYGVEKIKLLGKKITKILKENNISYDDDVAFVNKKLKRIEEHNAKNKQDKKAGREVVKYVSLKKRLENYKAKKAK